MRLLERRRRSASLLCWSVDCRGCVRGAVGWVAGPWVRARLVLRAEASRAGPTGGVAEFAEHVRGRTRQVDGQVGRQVSVGQAPYPISAEERRHVRLPTRLRSAVSLLGGPVEGA